MLEYLNYETYLSAKLKVLDLHDDGGGANHTPPPAAAGYGAPPPPPVEEEEQQVSEPPPLLVAFDSEKARLEALQKQRDGEGDGHQEGGASSSQQQRQAIAAGRQDEEEEEEQQQQLVSRRVSTGSTGRYGAPPSDDEEEDEEEEAEGGFSSYDDDPMEMDHHYIGYGEDEEEPGPGEGGLGVEEEQPEEVEVDLVSDLSRYAEQRRLAGLQAKNRAARLALERAEADADGIMEDYEQQMARLEGGGGGMGGQEGEEGGLAPWLVSVQRLQRRLKHRDDQLEKTCEQDMDGLLKRQREEREAREREQREKEQKERERRGKLEGLSAWTQDPSVPLERLERRLTQEGLQPISPDEHAMVAAAQALLRSAAALDASLGVRLQGWEEEKKAANGDGEALKGAAQRLAEEVKALPDWGRLKTRMEGDKRLFPNMAIFATKLDEIRKCLHWKPAPPPAPAAPTTTASAAPSQPPPPQAASGSAPSAASGGGGAPAAAGGGGGVSAWVTEVEGSVARMREWSEAVLGGRGASDEWDKALIEVLNLVAVDRAAMARGAEKLLGLLMQAKNAAGVQGALGFVWSFVRYAAAHPEGQQGLLRKTFPFHSHRSNQEDPRKSWDDFDLVWYARLLLAFCLVLGPNEHVALPSGQRLDAADVVLGSLALYVPFVVPTRPEWLDVSAAESQSISEAMDKCQRVGKEVFRVKNRGINQVKVVMKLLAQMMMTLTSRRQAAQLQADLQSWCPAQLKPLLQQQPGRLPFDGQSMYHWLASFTRTLDLKRRQHVQEGRPYAMATGLELFALGTFLAHEVPLEATALSPRQQPVLDLPEKNTECLTFMLQLPRTGTVAVLRERMGDQCFLPFCRVVVDVAYRPFLSYVLDEQAFKLPDKTRLEAPHWRLVVMRYLNDWMQPPPAVCFCRQPGCGRLATHYPACNFVDRSGKALGGPPPNPPVLALCDRDKSLSTMNEAAGVYLLKKVKDRIKSK